MRKYSDYSIKNLSHIKIGGTVETYLEIEEISELETLKNWVPYFVIGKGSNLLFDDGYFKETFVSLKRLNSVSRLPNGLIKVQAGCSLAMLLTFMAKEGFTGLEVLSGVPASVGGMLYMNAGANGISTYDFVESVTILDENHQLQTLSRSQIAVGYRYTEFQQRPCIIVEAVFKFPQTGYSFATAMDASASKKKKQPIHLPNLGSIFKNPSEMGAWKVVDLCGFRGIRRGGIEVSPMHSNFIVNVGAGKFDEMVSLISEIETKAYEQLGIQLEREIIIKRSLMKIEEENNVTR